MTIHLMRFVVFCLYAQGWSYDGDWEGDIPHGSGVMHIYSNYEDGEILISSYNGKWALGLRDGHGVLVDWEMQLTYEVHIE